MSDKTALVAATDYPLLNVFWTMFWLFLWILWIFLVVRVIIDIFRSDDLSGGWKALWLFVVVILPLFGVIVYLIAHGSDMRDREVGQAKQQEQDFREYVRDAAGSSDTTDQLTKLADLHDRGVLNDQEFAAQKAAVLGQSSGSTSRSPLGTP